MHTQEDWKRSIYTEAFLNDLSKKRDAAVAKLFGAASASTDPRVRQSMGEIEALDLIIGRLKVRMEDKE